MLLARRVVRRLDPRAWQHGREAAQPGSPPKLDLRAVALPLAIGLVIRLALAPFTVGGFDSQTWLQAAWAGAYHLPLYARAGFSYPSGWGHVLQITGQLFNALGLPTSSFATYLHQYASLSDLLGTYVPTPIFSVALKLPLFACDVATSALVAALVKRLTGNVVWARRSFAVIFLNPLIIFSSAVMANWNIAAALALVAAIYGVVTQRHVLAGCAAVVGILTKIVPAFAVPLLVVAIVCWTPGDRLVSKLRRSLRPLGLFAAAFVASGLIVILPEILNGSVATMWHATSLRASAGSIELGGYTIFALGQLRGFETLARFANSHAWFVLGTNHVSLALAVVFSCYALFRRPGAPSILLSGTLLTFLAVFVTAPLTQPHYFVWILPIAAVLWRTGRMRSIWFHLLWLVPLFGLLVARGPLAFLSPMALLTGWPPFTAIGRSAALWAATTPGSIATHVVFDWVTVGRILSIATDLPLIFLLGRDMLRCPATATAAYERALATAAPPVTATSSGTAPVTATSPGTAPVTATASQKTATPWSQLVIAARRLGASVGGLRTLSARTAASLALAGVLMASVVASATTVGGALGGALTQARLSGGLVSLGLRLPFSPGQDYVRLSAFPVSRWTRITQILVYEAPHSNSIGEDIASQLKRHLATEYGVRGWSIVTRDVGPGSLQRAFESPQTAISTAVVDTTGTLPYDIEAHQYLMRRWLLDGGTLVWFGNAYAPIDSALWRSRSDIFRFGRKRLRIEGPARVGQAGGQTPLGLALGTQYRFIWFPILEHSARADNGLDLGWRTGDFSSVESLPLGSGRIVLFGGPALDVTEVTTDVAILLMSRGYEAVSARNSNVVRRLVGRAEVHDSRITWTFALPAQLRGGGLLEVFAIDPNRFGVNTVSCLVRLVPGHRLQPKMVGCQPIARKG
jgi:hypothetical protein